MGDEEILYRRVLYGKNHYRVDESGDVYLSSTAFADKTWRPSVDRAELCGHDPSFTQQNEENAVVSVVCQDVREIDTVVENDKKGRQVLRHRVDVLPDPWPDNAAHAIVAPIPDYRKPKQVFRRLLEALVRLAQQRPWEILPWEIRRNIN